MFYFIWAAKLQVEEGGSYGSVRIEENKVKESCQNNKKVSVIKIRWSINFPGKENNLSR